MDKWAIVDVETTGMTPPYDRVIEVAVAQIDNGKLIHTWSSLINPNRSISPVITRITGITSQQVATAPQFEDISIQLQELLEDRLFVAHNVQFDYKFIKAEFELTHREFHPPRLCSVRLSRELFPRYKRHGLGEIIKRFDIQIGQHHRAMDDVSAVWQFVEKSKSLVGDKKINQVITELTKTPSLPSNISKKQIDRLPKSPGVYFFYDQDGTLMYVGKSINIRDRVKSHFYSPINQTKEQLMIHKVASVEFETCAGELDALLLESRLVKEKKPVYNHQLREKKVLNLLFLQPNLEGLLEPNIINSPEIHHQDLPYIFGVFKNKRKVTDLLRKLAKEEGLCLKALGLEKGNGACFAYQLQNCSGWCAGKTSTEEHNQQLTSLLKKKRFKSWPFSGPAFISEYSLENDISRVHVFDQWCHINSYDQFSLPNKVGINQQTLSFDLDTYNILKKFIHQAKPFQAAD